MRIKQLIWPEDRIEHIGRHGVTPEEVEEICFGDSLAYRSKSRGKNPVYLCARPDRSGQIPVLRGDPIPGWHGIPSDREVDDDERETPVPEMEESMRKKPKIPKTDSIEELAEFWDTHDFTDYEGELEEVSGKAFARPGRRAPRAIKVPLEPDEAKVVEKIARAEGITLEQLISRWVRQKVATQAGAHRIKRSA